MENLIVYGGEDMVFDASSKIAVKCSKCGKYNIIDLNIFNLKSKREFNCSCGQTLLSAHINKKELITDINCIACENKHSYRFKIREVVEGKINIITCPYNGMEIAFLGKNERVDSFVKRYMDDMYQLLKYLGVV